MHEYHFLALGLFCSSRLTSLYSLLDVHVLSPMFAYEMCWPRFTKLVCLERMTKSSSSHISIRDLSLRLAELVLSVFLPLTT